MQCEVCGNAIRPPPQIITIDEAIFRVCHTCAKRGTPVNIPQVKPKIPAATTSRQHSFETEPLTELRDNFHTIIKQGREKLRLSQEELGQKINEKPSVIAQLEVGKLKPNDRLTRKVENFLKIKLLVPYEGDL